MNMEKISLDLNEKEERDSAEISQVTMADIVQIDKCMIKPSAQTDGGQAAAISHRLLLF
jgi:hypothetical protein